MPRRHIQKDGPGSDNLLARNCILDYPQMNTPPANSGEKGRRGYSDQTTPDKGD